MKYETHASDCPALCQRFLLTSGRMVEKLCEHDDHACACSRSCVTALYEIHEEDCPRLKCCAQEYRTDAYSGVSCNGDSHDCLCSGSRMVAVDAAALKKLVDAADDAYYSCLSDGVTKESVDALQPFRAETEEKK